MVRGDDEIGAAIAGQVADVNRFVRTPEQIMAALFRNPTVEQPTEPRPESVLQ